MAKSNHPNGQNQAFDPDTGEVLGEEQMFGGVEEGTQPDGSIVVPKITMSTVRANPERAKLANRPMKIALITGMGGGEHLMPPMDQEARLNDLPLESVERMTFTALVATIEPWGCIVFDDNGEPDAVYKSDYLFLPIGQIACINRLRRLGAVPLAFEFWAQPNSNPRGYSWSYKNLAKYDRDISPIDRMLRLGVHAGRMLENQKETGLLADLRAHR